LSTRKTLEINTNTIGEDLKFQLVLEKTYYNQGFFNVKIDHDRYIRKTEGPITVQLGTDGRELICTVNRTANMNNTARILGRSKLRDWFYANFKPMETVWVEVVSSEYIVILGHELG